MKNRLTLGVLLGGLALTCLGCSSENAAAPTAPTPPPAGGSTPTSPVKTSPGEMPPPPGVQVPSAPK